MIWGTYPHDRNPPYWTSDVTRQWKEFGLNLEPQISRGSWSSPNFAIQTPILEYPQSNMAGNPPFSSMTFQGKHHVWLIFQRLLTPSQLPAIPQLPHGLPDAETNKQRDAKPSESMQRPKGTDTDHDDANKVLLLHGDFMGILVAYKCV